MRVVARAYRPRVTPTAYGRATGLPSFRPNQQYRADTPHFQDRRYRRQESKIYDHSIVTLTQLNIINVEIAAPTAAALFQLLAGPVFLTGGDTALRTGDGGVELETAELW